MNVSGRIQNHIYEVRGKIVILDFDLAFLYEVQTKVLNQAVKRNRKRFPKDFMFQLTKKEWEMMWSQFVTSSIKRRPKTARPYAFTEHGVTMLSGILNSSKAIQMNIAIIRAFVEIKRIILEQADIRTQLKSIQQKISDHDVQLSGIYDAIENILDEKVTQTNWYNRERIGFKK